MQSTTVVVPYERMVCWATDSFKIKAPWNNAKLKLIHYIDSASCSTCYLQKAIRNEQLHQMEILSNYEFCNIFIINPGNKDKKRLESDFLEEMLLQILFVDTANVFKSMNPNIPSETMWHTFLLDENNNVILVGNPIANEKIMLMLQSIVKKKFFLKNEQMI